MGRNINNRDLRQNNTQTTSSVQTKVVRPELLQAKQEKANSDAQEKEYYYSIYPELKNGNYSLEYLRKYHEARNKSNTQVSKDNKTEQQHQQSQSDAKELRDMKEASEKLDQNLILASVPLLYPFAQVGWDQRYKNITGQNFTPYTLPAGISIAAEAIAPFVPEGINYASQWAKRTFGSKANRVAAVMNQTLQNPVNIESQGKFIKYWKNDPTKFNITERFGIAGQPERGYFELVKDNEPGFYSVHFKPTDKNNPQAFSQLEKQGLFQAVADAVPEGNNLSTWGELSPGGIAGLNRFRNLGFTQTGTRPIHMKSGELVDIPIYTKNNTSISPDIVYSTPSDYYDNLAARVYPAQGDKYTSTNGYSVATRNLEWYKQKYPNAINVRFGSVSPTYPFHKSSPTIMSDMPDSDFTPIIDYFNNVVLPLAQKRGYTLTLPQNRPTYYREMPHWVVNELGQETKIQPNNNLGGWFNRRENRAYLNYANSDNVSTGIHEYVSHPTDYQLPKEDLQLWGDLPKFLEDNQMPRISGNNTFSVYNSNSSVESRAMWEEVRKDLVDNGKIKIDNYGNLDTSELTEKDILSSLKKIGNPKLTLKEIRKKSKPIETYSDDYISMYLSMDPSKRDQFMQKVKQALRNLPSETVGKSKSPYYFQNGQWNTSAMGSDIKAGIQDYTNEVLSPEYAEVAIRNMEEAEKMGLYYTPVFETSSFKSLLEDGINPKLDWNQQRTFGNASTGMFGATPGYKTDIDFWGYSPVSYRQSSAHEGAHVARHGMPSRDVSPEIAQKEYEYLKYKSSEVFKDGFEAGPYVFTGKGAQTGEGYTNCRDLGKELGVSFAQPYPGDKKVLELLNSEVAKNSTKSGLIKGFRMDNLQAVWRALNGTQWMIIPGLLGAALSNKQGGKLVPKAKSGIHIKKKNRGKFTKSAKAAGQSVQEHARSVLNNPNATPLQKKRANFARNAAKWHKK